MLCGCVWQMHFTVALCWNCVPCISRLMWQFVTPIQRTRSGKGEEAAQQGLDLTDSL